MRPPLPHSYQKPKDSPTPPAKFKLAFFVGRSRLMIDILSGRAPPWMDLEGPHPSNDLRPYFQVRPIYCPSTKASELFTRLGTLFPYAYGAWTVALLGITRTLSLSRSVAFHLISKLSSFCISLAQKLALYNQNVQDSIQGRTRETNRNGNAPSFSTPRTFVSKIETKIEQEYTAAVRGMEKCELMQPTSVFDGEFFTKCGNSDRILWLALRIRKPKYCFSVFPNDNEHLSTKCWCVCWHFSFKKWIK